MGRPKKQVEIPTDAGYKLDVNGTSGKTPTESPLEQVSEGLPFNVNLPFIHPDLKTTLEKCPHVNCVWMDDKGTWYFCEKPGFTAYSREQILNW